MVSRYLVVEKRGAFGEGNYLCLFQDRGHAGGPLEEPCGVSHQEREGRYGGRGPFGLVPLHRWAR